MADKLQNSEKFTTKILQAVNEKQWNGKKPIKL